MSEIQDFVNVTVTRKTKALDQKSFGTTLVLAYHTHYVDRAREYREADDMLDDGFSVTDKAYLDVQAAKSQNPAPEKVKVGRRANADTQIVHIIPSDLSEGVVNWVKVDGVTYSYTNGPGEDAASVADGLVAAMSSVPGVGVTDASTHALTTADTAGDVHTFEVSETLRLLDATADSGVVADLAAIRAYDSDWYGLALDNYSAAVIAAAAVWAEANSIVMGLQTSDWNVKDAGETGDIATALMGSSYTRMFGTWKGVLGGSFAAAFVARVLAVNPGKETPAHLTIVGQPVDDLSATEETTIQNKRFGIYTSTAGFAHTFEGKTPSNEFIDQVIGSDWLKFRMQEAVFGSFANADKVEQENTGIAVIETSVWSILKQGSSKNFPILKATGLEVFVPDIDDVSSADKLARNLTGIYWKGFFSGAFHKAKPINGYISV